MSFSEYVRYKTGNVFEPDATFSPSDAALLRHHLIGYLERGGFIATLEQTPADAIQLLQEYASRTVAMDVVERYDVKNPRPGIAVLDAVYGIFGTRAVSEQSVQRVQEQTDTRQS